MEGAKKKDFDDSLNLKIQRKFDLVFGSASELISAGTKAETAAMDDDFSSLEFGSDEGSSMSESAKKEKSPPKIDLDFGNDGDLDFSSMSDSPPAESKKEGTGKLSIVPDDSEGLEFNLDFGDDTPDVPAVPAATASAPPADKAKGEATKSDSHFELDLSGGDDDNVIETRPSNTQASAAHAEAAEGGLELGGDLFDAEIEMASSKARNEKKESTQPTIVYNKSATGIDLESFKESTASTNSSADLMTTEEAKANIESTIKDILRPKLSADSTQEIDLSEMEEKAADPIPEMNFSNDGFSADGFPSEEFTTDSFNADKNEATNEFDLSGMEFADKEESMAAPAVKMKAEAPAAMKAAANFDSIPDARMERVDRAHTSFVSDEESSRFQATIRQLREERDQLLTEIKMLKGQAREIEQDNLTLKAALDEAKIENSIIRKRHMTEMEDLKYKAALAEEKRALAEEKARNAEAKKEKLEQRVRIDFNQVKQREKELETKLEMLSMDVDSQVQGRDQKILELRRKIDALEFNMENVSIREQKSKDDKRKLEDKLNKIMKTLRHSIKNLEDDIDQVTEESESDTDDKIKTGHGQR